MNGKTFTAPPKIAADTAAYGVSDGEVISDCTFIGDKGSEALKISRNVKSGADITHCTFSGGVEDCVDVLGSHNVTFTACMFLRGNARRDVTVKGSAQNIHFINCIGLQYVTAGDVTIYEKAGLLPPVDGCYIHNQFGKKTIVLCINSKPWKGDVINIVVPRPFVRLYFWARWKFFP
jgi:hypothetical protein